MTRNRAAASGPRIPAAALAFAAGAAAAMLELVWARWLVLSVGAGAPALALAAGGTMLGLGLGGELGGRWAARARSPRRLFALVSLGAAAAGAAASAVLLAAGGEGFPALSDAGLRGLALALVTAPSILIGACWPALAAEAERGAGRGAALARLYAANTAGAVAGALAAGYVLIAALGFRATAGLAVALAAAAGLATLADAGGGSRPEPRAGAAAPPGAAAAALAGAAASGFATMAFEVLDTRLLVHGLLATTHALTIALAAFLAGLALGARLFAAARDAGRARVGRLGAALVAGALVAAASAPALGAASAFAARLKLLPWELHVAGEAALALVLLLPSTTVLGLAFPAALAAGADSPRASEALGRALLVNALAGAAGALGAGFLLLPALGVRGALLAVAFAQACVGAVLIAREPGWSARRRRGAALAPLALAAFAALWARPPRLGSHPGEGTLAAQHVLGVEPQYRLLCYRDGPVATTEVLEQVYTLRRDLLIDGFVAAGSAETAAYMTLMGSVPMRVHPNPRRALVICFGTGATARAAARSGAALDLVDLNPDVFACAPSFGPENEALLARSRVSVEDGRRFLARGGPGYDVITQEPMPPYFAGASALYSLEYYELARRRLNPGGILVQWLPLHLVAPDDARAIVATALAVFPETWVALSPTDGTALVVSSNAPLPRARVAAAERELGARFLAAPDAARRFAAGAAPVTDDRPTLEYSGLDRVRARFPTGNALRDDNVARLLESAR